MSIVLAYPSTPPHTLEIVLKDPEYGDGRQLNLKTTLKQNMAGALYTHKKTPTNSKIVLTFNILTLNEKNALVSFYNQMLGNEIEYTDPAGTQWQCRLANDNLVITTITDTCSYNVTIELLTV
jgi:hypothetical protein